MKSSCSHVLASIFTFITMYLEWITNHDRTLFIQSNKIHVPVDVEHSFAHLDLLFQQNWVFGRDFQQEHVGSVGDKDLQDVLQAWKLHKEYFY